MNIIFKGILQMSADASILIAAVILVRIFMQKAPKYFRKILWGLVGLRLIFPFSLQSIFSLVPQEVNTAAENVAQQVTVAGAQGAEPSALMLLPYVWFGVFATLCLYGVISFVKLKLKISDAVLDKENVYLSEKVDSPFVCGFIKPKIYLPYGVDENIQNYILHHERTHIKYGDHILKAAGFLLVCVYWFNPFVWASYFLFCKDIELACDELVIKDYDEASRRKYAKAIFEIGVNKVKLSACPVAFGEVGIKDRVKSALSYKKVKKAFVAVSIVACVAVALCFMTEPKAEAANAENKPVAEETTTEPVTEPSTEAVTEPATEPETTTEPTTEEATTEVMTEPVAEVYEEKTETESTEFRFKIQEPEYPRYDPWTTRRYYTPTTTDPVYEQAVEDGLFMDSAEKGFFIQEKLKDQE